MIEILASGNIQSFWGMVKDEPCYYSEEEQHQMQTKNHNQLASIIDKVEKKLLTSIETTPYRVLRKFDYLLSLNSSRSIPQEIIDFLESLQADSIAHTKRSLLKHLQKTYFLLQKWGNPDYLCLAGLFHSIYGTQDFKELPMLLENRKKVRNVIGSQAEKLVYYFCIQDRRHFVSNFDKNQKFTILSRLDKKEILISEKEFKDLLEIRIADHLEQMLYTKHQYGFRDFFLKAQPYLSDQCREYFSIAYRAVL
ncbi:DUF6817 domain-containing protein [Crocosphaera sp.]|uniref:DUF6817 domain-containing protein n=1 Tax=Crocosphaera sp. TaxID=2729996 RepID=UPI002614FD5C|nr:hypothetical protein [Crocosphaera sp.]MDJ0582177.1 hypothetical protein [Crocosphaera sp.]